MEYISLIKSTFIGSQLTEDEIITQLHALNFKVMHFDKGTVLHLEGDDCIYLEILLAGNIVNMQIDPHGTSHVVECFEKNDLIAGNILFGSLPTYPLSFYAQSGGMMLQIKKAYLFELFIKNPSILKQFLIIISERAMNLTKKIKLGKQKPLRSLITEYLHFQSLLQNSATVTLPISKSELAATFGVQRTSVSREFSRMEKDGIISISDNKKTIKIEPRPAM